MAADSPALSRRCRYTVNSFAYAFARFLATAGLGSLTENVSKSEVRSALTVEFASREAAVRSRNFASFSAIAATLPTRASFACVATYRSGGDATPELVRFKACAVGLCAFTRTLADAWYRCS